MALCGIDGKNIVNRGNSFEVNGKGLEALIKTGVISQDEEILRNTKAIRVLGVLLCSPRLRLRGYGSFDKNCLTDINFDEIFWVGKVLPSKNDILRFMSIVNHPDELEVTLHNLRAWWD